MSEQLTPVRCGCGGEAIVHEHEYGEYEVYCPRCFITTDDYATEAEAVTAWNRAMGAKDINVPNKERTAKVDAGYKSVINGKLIDGHCMTCGRYVMDEDDYCPGCGARLEWE